MSKPSLFEQIGGSKELEHIVCDFYQNILMDDSISIFYIENVSDIAQLHHLMQDFLTMLLGGPNEYKGRDMKEAHKHMPIEMRHFDTVWGHMEDAFRKHKTC
jgi:hemoglobin